MYTIKCKREACNTDIDYIDAILRDVLARGIADQEIQLELLGDQNQDMSVCARLCPFCPRVSTCVRCCSSVSTCDRVSPSVSGFVRECVHV